MTEISFHPAGLPHLLVRPPPSSARSPPLLPRSSPPFSTTGQRSPLSPPTLSPNPPFAPPPPRRQLSTSPDGTTRVWDALHSNAAEEALVINHALDPAVGQAQVARARARRTPPRFSPRAWRPGWAPRVSLRPRAPLGCGGAERPPTEPRCQWCSRIAGEQGVQLRVEPHGDDVRAQQPGLLRASVVRPASETRCDAPPACPPVQSTPQCLPASSRPRALEL